jgi:hypothetical protein
MPRKPKGTPIHVHHKAKQLWELFNLIPDQREILKVGDSVRIWISRRKGTGQTGRWHGFDHYVGIITNITKCYMTFTLIDEDYKLFERRLKTTNNYTFKVVGEGGSNGENR